MSTISFPIATPRELLNKASRELEQLKAHANGFHGEPDPIAVADLTINVAWSLWHVTDWIGSSKEADVLQIVPECISRVGRERTAAFQNQLRSESRELEICWALSLRFKHFELEASSHANSILDTDEYLSASSSFEVSERSKQAEPVAALSASQFRVNVSQGGMVTAITELPSTTLHPKVTSEGERLRLVDVYGKAYRFLDELLKKHGL